MPITLLNPHPEAYTKYVLPQRSGVEPRDLRAFPLPPNASQALVAAVVDELRAQGHTVTVSWKREQLVDWTATHRFNQHSYGSEDGWQLNPNAPAVLRFVGGGWHAKVVCDGRETVLEAQHLRMGRAMLRLVICGHP